MTPASWDAPGSLPIAYNTPIRKLFATVAAFLLFTVPVGHAQPPSAKDGRGRGGVAPKNLQVPNEATFPNAMQSFVEALGVADKRRCNYCHVEDRASDGKTQKAIARKMIIMVHEINGHFPDGKEHVTCYT